MDKRPVVLLIMDGFGLDWPSEYNAVSTAKTPNLDALYRSCPYTTLQASGEDVGLPAGQIGNSEVGHTNIGAGRVVYQILPRISNAIADGSFFENPVYLQAVDKAVQTGHPVHVLGLLSDGGVHSHISHIKAFVELCRRRGAKQCWVHALLDGRDVPPASGSGYVKQLADYCAEIGYGRIATIQGRYWGMDRDKNWDRVEKGYRAMVCGEGVQNADPVAAVEASYASGVTDEFVEPVVCDAAGCIGEGDTVVFINFRPDRARQLTWAFNQKDFSGFVLPKGQFPVNYVCTAQYDESMTDLPVAFPPETIENTFGEYVSANGLRQLRCAETEKYAHVTFFFNGGVERVSPGEDRILVPSPKEYATYDLIPEMSAYKVTENVVNGIASGDYDTIIVNLANCDMVGHTGVMQAAVKAVETVDDCVGKITEAVKQQGGVLLITADHGNADRMVAADGTPHTAHTVNPVPLILVGAEKGTALRPGRLADLAPTMLYLMGLPQPPEMTGKNLIIL